MLRMLHFCSAISTRRAHVLLEKIVLVAEYRLLHVIADALDVGQRNLVVAQPEHSVHHAGVAAGTRHSAAASKRKERTE